MLAVSLFVQLVKEQDKIRQNQQYYSRKITQAMADTEERIAFGGWRDKNEWLASSLSERVYSAEKSPTQARFSAPILVSRPTLTAFGCEFGDGIFLSDNLLASPLIAH